MTSMSTEIEQVAARLLAEFDTNKVHVYKHPVKAVIIRLIKQLQQALFPGYFENTRIKNSTMAHRLCFLLDDIVSVLARQINFALQFSRQCQNDPGDVTGYTAADIASQFIARLPDLREYLEYDIEAAYEGDPAARNKSEVIISYPGVYAVMVYRLAHELHLLSVPIIPRMMTEYAHGVTGIDIHPGATIGKHFFMDHGTGIVIGETTIIGDHVKVYQGVTLGALSTSGGRQLKHVKRHPTICDHVTIYSGASIFGGETVIGENAVIGGNAFVVKSIPSQTRVSIRNPELLYKNRSDSAAQSELEQSGDWFYMI